MYKKGTAVEIQFSPARLNDAAGDPYWLDLSRDEAQQLLALLQARLHAQQPDAAPLMFSLDGATAGTGDAAIFEADFTVADDAGLSSEMAAPPPGQGMRQWVCIICGWIYDEALGVPEEGIPAGTPWAEVPADWRCPLCDVGKEDFALVEF